MDLEHDFITPMMNPSLNKGETGGANIVAPVEEKKENSKQGLQKKRWVFVLNNPTEEEKQHIYDLGSSLEQCLYLVVGLETAPETGTLHLQGYVEMRSRKRMTAMKKFLGARVHLEAAKASGVKNRAYCTKDGNYLEFGKISALSRGKRSDLEEIRERIVDGATDLELANEYFSQWVCYEKSFKKFRLLLKEVKPPVYMLESFPVDWQNLKVVKSHIFWGESGIGKTCFAKALLPKGLVVRHMDDLLNFDCQKHEGIIFDDMDFKHLPRTSQIHLVDFDDDSSIHCRYSCAFIPAGTVKIFTTNECDGLIFLLEDAAIKRRVSVHHLVKI